MTFFFFTPFVVQGKNDIISDCFVWFLSFCFVLVLTDLVHASSSRSAGLQSGPLPHQVHRDHQLEDLPRIQLGLWPGLGWDHLLLRWGDPLLPQPQELRGVLLAPDPCSLRTRWGSRGDRAHFTLTAYLRTTVRDNLQPSWARNCITSSSFPLWEIRGMLGEDFFCASVKMFKHWSWWGSEFRGNITSLVLGRGFGEGRSKSYWFNPRICGPTRWTDEVPRFHFHLFIFDFCEVKCKSGTPPTYWDDSQKLGCFYCMFTHACTCKDTCTC